MKIRVFPLLVSGALIAAVVTPSLEADAEPTPIAPVAPAGHLSYVDREKLAAPAIKTQLAQLRAELAANKLPYTVGYTTAMDRSLANLTGLVVPKDVATQAAAHAPIQAQLLQTDEKNRLEIIKRFPGRFPIRIDPTFNAASARGDWRALGKVSPIRDQGSCGSCWAFAAIGAYEASYAIRNNVNADTSEQAVLSCGAAGTCAGGWTAPALAWLTSHGTDKESEYPYTATTGTCHGFTVDYKASAWGYISPNGTIPSTQQMKDAIVAHGPIVVALYATPQFQAYTGGVFYQTVPAGALNHAVVLVGWDDNQVGPNGAKGAWIMRNSWGTGWGTFADFGTANDRGYMYLAYGSSNVGIWAQWVHAPVVAP